MTLKFKEKSFFDEDVEVFDESEMLIANFNKQHGDYFLSFNKIEYFVKADGSLNFKSEIINVKSKEKIVDINTTSKWGVSFKYNNKQYSYAEEFPLGYNFNVKDENKNIILYCTKNLLTNNGEVTFKQDVHVIIVLFSILIKLNRRKLMQEKFISFG